MTANPDIELDPLDTLDVCPPGVDCGCLDAFAASRENSRIGDGPLHPSRILPGSPPANGEIVEIPESARSNFIAWLEARSHLEPSPYDWLAGDCRIWDGPVNPAGYGQVWLRRDDMRPEHGTPHKYGRKLLVHRLAWIERHGAIPKKKRRLGVLHHCDRPACFADGHLFLGTKADNVTDMMAKGRHALRRPPHPPKTAQDPAEHPEGSEKR